MRRLHIRAFHHPYHWHYVLYTRVLHSVTESTRSFDRNCTPHSNVSVNARALTSKHEMLRFNFYRVAKTDAQPADDNMKNSTGSNNRLFVIAFVMPSQVPLVGLKRGEEVPTKS